MLKSLVVNFPYPLVIFKKVKILILNKHVYDVEH